MNTHVRRWIVVGPIPRRRDLVPGAGIALVELEVVAREVLGLDSHDPIAGHLGQDRGGGDGQAGGVALDDAGGVATAHEVPRAVDEHVVRLEVQPGDGSAGGQLLGRGHAQRVALEVAGVTDRPGHAPLGDPIEHGLALALGEHLGVADLVDATVARYHRGPDAERPGPRPPTDLVDPDHHRRACGPQLPLDRQTWRLGPDRLAQAGRGDGGSHERDPIAATRLLASGRASTRAAPP